MRPLHSPEARRPRTARRFVGITIAVALVVAAPACGGGGSDGASAVPPGSQATDPATAPTGGTTTSSTTTTSMTSTGSTPAQLQVDKSAYLSATEIHVDTVAYDQATGEITIEGLVTNGNPFDKSATDLLSIVPATIDFGTTRADVRRPIGPTPAGSSSEVQWTATLDAGTEIDLTEGRLIIGGPDDNQAIVPFGDDPATSIVPVVDALEGTTVASPSVRAVVRTSLLRGTSTGATEGHRRLDLLVDVSGLVEKVGGYRCNTDAFLLRFPDGSTSIGIAPEDGRGLGSVLGLGIMKSDWVSFDLTTQTGPATLELTTPDVEPSVGSVPIVIDEAGTG